MEKKFVTSVRALDPRRVDRRLFEYYGPVIEAESKVKAQEKCMTTGLGYCKVLGLFIMDIRCPDGQIATLYYNNDRDN